MIDFLRTYYGIQGQESFPIRRYSSYVENNIHYLVIPIRNRDEFNLEQAVLSYYLKEHHQPNIGFPLQNIDEQFITVMDDQTYVVVQIDDLQDPSQTSNGSILAEFHQRHQAYPYEPRSISSYGTWKQLWIDKLTVYEQNLQASLSERRSYFERAWLDVFPYVIGMTENAIQYIGTIEKEAVADSSDRPTITFERYRNQLKEHCFFHHELHFDHPMRDVAEFIRFKLLQDHVDVDDISRFLKEYNDVQFISEFSWKLLYARLLYPAHFFDYIDRHRLKKDETKMKQEMLHLCKAQENYEVRLNTLFQHIKQNHQKIHIPMLQWL